MGRRGQGEGSIRKRDEGRWEARFQTGAVALGGQSRGLAVRAAGRNAEMCRQASRSPQRLVWTRGDSNP
jgi:hypothetical protein